MVEEPAMPRVALFFTWDVSLALWQEKGLLAREVRLYEELAKKGVEVVFLSWGGAEDLEIAKTLPQGIEVVPLYQYLPKPNNKALRALGSLLLPFKLSKVLKACDLYKTNQMWGGWCAALAKIAHGKPLIVRCGFELYDFTCKQGHSGLRRWFVKLISRFTYRRASQICIATPHDREFVNRVFKAPAHKLNIHPNWIDGDVFAPQDVPKKENSILFVGRLTEQKNLEALIEAVAGTVWTLDIIGDGELRQSLESLVKERNANVNFLGALPNDQLPALYNTYPVYVLPSHYEGNPKTLLEAMSCGCAVVGTAVPGIENVIEDGKTGLLCATDSQNIKQALDILMGDAALRERLGQEAREQILRNQTLDRLVEKELALYGTLKKGKA